VIEPLPLVGAKGFEPFFYGDHLWQAMSAFPNFTGLSDLRQPRGAGAPSGHRTAELPGVTGQRDLSCVARRRAHSDTAH
jgi:hypothetical protein